MAAWRRLTTAVVKASPRFRSDPVRRLHPRSLAPAARHSSNSWRTREDSGGVRDEGEIALDRRLGVGTVPEDQNLLSLLRSISAARSSLGVCSRELRLKRTHASRPEILLPLK